MVVAARRPDRCFPQSIADELIPLQIDPSPDETIRVMVGRHEILTTQAARRIAEFIAESATRHASEGSDDSARQSDDEQLKQLGRWAEPAIARIKNTTTDPNLLKEGERLLVLLRHGIGHHGERRLQ